MLSRAGRVAARAILGRNRRPSNKLTKKKVEKDEVIDNNNNKDAE